MLSKIIPRFRTDVDGVMTASLMVTVMDGMGVVEKGEVMSMSSVFEGLIFSLLRVIQSKMSVKHNVIFSRHDFMCAGSFVFTGSHSASAFNHKRQLVVLILKMHYINF